MASRLQERWCLQPAVASQPRKHSTAKMSCPKRREDDEIIDSMRDTDGFPMDEVFIEGRKAISIYTMPPSNFSPCQSMGSISDEDDDNQSLQTTMTMSSPSTRPENSAASDADAASSVKSALSTADGSHPPKTNPMNDDNDSSTASGRMQCVTECLLD